MADKQVEIKVATSVDDDEVKALEERLEEINSKSTLVNVDVEGDEEVDATKEKVDELDGTENRKTEKESVIVLLKMINV